MTAERKPAAKAEDIVDAEIVKDDEAAAEQDHLAALEGKWRALAAPFPADQIELLPQNVGKYNRDAPRFNCIEGHQDFRKASKDGIACGGWHQWSVHLRYIGHAGITMRLNEVDPMWTWEPVAINPQTGTPLYTDGGMWIRLTVLGVTRLGFGDPGKNNLGTPNGTKELIGDALRNAAMRFGVGTYLWSKSDKAAKLQAGDIPEEQPPAPPAQPQPQPEPQQAPPPAAQQQPEPVQQPAQQEVPAEWNESTEAGFQSALSQNWNNAAALKAMGNWYSKNPNTPQGHLQKIRDRINQIEGTQV